MQIGIAKKQIIETYATSAVDPIYALKNTVPPEVFGAFGAYFSRNPKDFREHLYAAVSGQVEQEGLELTENNLTRVVKRVREDPVKAISEGLKKSRNFFEKWYGGYSHKSIANTVWIPMVATGVSQMFARELAYEQLAFFIEQSSRYVPWGLDNMFHDPDIMAGQHAEKYTSTLRVMTQGYHELTNEAIGYYMEKNPFPIWLNLQSNRIQNAEVKVQDAAYSRQIKGAALDVSRFLLPQAALTNIAWICDARSTEFDIAAWKEHPLSEIRKAAVLIEKHAGQITPALLKYTENNHFYGRQLTNFDFTLPTAPAEPFTKGVEIIAYDPDSLNRSVAHLLHRHSVGGTFAQQYVEVAKMSFDKKIELLRQVVANRGPHDEWVSVDEEFDQVKISVEIRSDLGAVRDWRRHQKWDRAEPLYTTDNGFHRPNVINNMSSKAGKIFDTAVTAAREAELAIRPDLPYQAQYIVPMATMHPIVMSAGLDQAQYMLWTRSTPQGNFSYREDAFNLAEAFVKTHPWIFGYEIYPESREFLDIYTNAPLKGLLRLQIGETALHQ